MEKEKKERLKKKASIGILASLTSISVLLGGVFDSPKELVEENHEKPVILIENIDDYSEDELENEEGKDHTGYKDKLKRQIYRIPLRIRMIFCVPLWCLGTMILSLGEFLWGSLLSPVLNVLLTFLLQTIILMAVIGICVKLLFPDLPWRKIFNKRTLLAVLIGSLIMSLLDAVLPLFWKEYRYYKMLGKFLIGLVILTIVMRWFIKKKIEDMNTIEIHYQLPSMIQAE
ncbi:MAG: hypothetical protein IIZ33_02200 [Erysipelotrichaceae bacterium]|nr:hypothetical protein [Erysipelotrichaceae bacterium]